MGIALKAAGPFSRPRVGKEKLMMRALFVIVTLGLFSAALVGCRGEAEIDVDEAAAIPAMR